MHANTNPSRTRDTRTDLLREQLCAGYTPVIHPESLSIVQCKQKEKKMKCFPLVITSYVNSPFKKTVLSAHFHDHVKSDISYYTSTALNSIRVKSPVL